MNDWVLAIIGSGVLSGGVGHFVAIRRFKRKDNYDADASATAAIEKLMEVVNKGTAEIACLHDDRRKLISRIEEMQRNYDEKMDMLIKENAQLKKGNSELREETQALHEEVRKLREMLS